MVQIQEEQEVEEEHNAHPQPQPHQTPSSSNMNINSSSPFPSPSPTPSPPHPSSPPPASPDTVSSISSDHTFHGFSPSKSHLPSPSPSPPIHTAASTPPALSPAPVAVPVANRLVRDQPEAVTKTESDAETGFAGERGGLERKVRRPVSVLRSARREKLVKRAGLFLRFVQFVVCLVSFSVMAADKRRGWALDSFDRYVEFRYSMSVGIIGFAYSAVQELDLLIQLMTGKDAVRSKLRCYFNFAMDQILAYLLLSSSSSAFTRVDDWISNWGKDKFPAMASASVGVSFVAFIAFALSSLISGYVLCTHKFT